MTSGLVAPSRPEVPRRSGPGAPACNPSVPTFVKSTPQEAVLVMHARGTMRAVQVAYLIGWLVGVGCGSTDPEATTDPEEPVYEVFSSPVRVVIEGYDADAMEPFLSRDGRYLFFNNLNDPSVNTELHVAERVDALRFTYRGPLTNANTEALEGVPTMDRSGTLYFVSTRNP